MAQHYTPAPEGKDPEIWEAAQERTDFKEHVTTFLLINLFMWAGWLITGIDGGFRDKDSSGIPWPLWATLSWGVGLAFHFASVYIFPQQGSVEKEYEKLKSKNQ